MFYFINSLFERKKSIEVKKRKCKISRVSNFFFSFKLNEKRMPLKHIAWRREVTRTFLLEECLIFNKGVGNISKKGGGLTIEGACDPQRNHSTDSTSRFIRWAISCQWSNVNKVELRISFYHSWNLKNK